MRSRIAAYVRQHHLALLCLFLILGGGTAWALAPNSIKSRHIKDGQVKAPDIAPGAVNSSHLSAGSIQSEFVPQDELTGEDIDESSLGSVPNASDSDALDGLDSSDFEPAGNLHRSGLEHVALPAGIGSNTITLMSASGYTFKGVCENANQEYYARIVVEDENEAGNYVSRSDGDFRAWEYSVALDQATVAGDPNAVGGKTRSFTLARAYTDEVFQGEAFYAVNLADTGQCYFAVSGTFA